jgi:DNA modification methylase
MNDFSPHGVDLFGDPIKPPGQSVVASRFIMPPFSVLNAREGDWQDRKRAWIALGIKSEQGRDAAAFGDCSEWQTTRKILPGGGGPNSLYRKETAKIVGDGQSQTSIFDPVLCELAYSWFTAPGMQILDPFAGGSVRGIVAGMLDRKYQGHELRAEQVAANLAQCAEIAPQAAIRYVTGDSAKTIPDAPECDFVFSCPPYGNLEVYSDNPDDLSAMDHDAFLVGYRDIIAKACAKLRQDRFACFVVGDFRDKRGNYRNFVSDTIQAFLDAGLTLYNEAILVTSVGSACMRVTKQFDASRKFAKTHQNILVFVKGDAKKATNQLNQ